MPSIDYLFNDMSCERIEIKMICKCYQGVYLVLLKRIQEEAHFSWPNIKQRLSFFLSFPYFTPSYFLSNKQKMNRLFGSGKKIPKPTLNDAISNVNGSRLRITSLLIFVYYVDRCSS